MMRKIYRLNWIFAFSLFSTIFLSLSLTLFLNIIAFFSSPYFHHRRKLLKIMLLKSKQKKKYRNINKKKIFSMLAKLYYVFFFNVVYLFLFYAQCCDCTAHVLGNILTLSALKNPHKCLQASKCACFYALCLLLLITKCTREMARSWKKKILCSRWSIQWHSTFTHTIIQFQHPFVLFSLHSACVFCFYFDSPRQFLWMLSDLLSFMLFFLFHTFSGSQHKKNLFFISHSMLIAYYFAFASFFNVFFCFGNTKHKNL